MATRKSGTSATVAAEPTPAKAKTAKKTVQPETQTIAKADVGTIPAAAVTGQQVKKEKVMPTLEEALLTAVKADTQGRFKNVVRVTELTNAGEPKRVVIKCDDPQTKMVGTEAVSVCVGEREIAIQDLFQVHRCEPCADRVVRRARRYRQKRKNKSLREMARAMKAG